VGKSTLGQFVAEHVGSGRVAWARESRKSPGKVAVSWLAPMHWSPPRPAETEGEAEERAWGLLTRAEGLAARRKDRLCRRDLQRGPDPAAWRLDDVYEWEQDDDEYLQEVEAVCHEFKTCVAALLPEDAEVRGQFIEELEGAWALAKESDEPPAAALSAEEVLTACERIAEEHDRYEAWREWRKAKRERVAEAMKVNRYEEGGYDPRTGAWAAAWSAMQCGSERRVGELKAKRGSLASKWSRCKELWRKVVNELSLFGEVTP
jgi:hypothetical protein